MWTVGIRPTFPVASELSKSTSIYFGVFFQKWDENALLIQLCFSNWTYQRLLACECLWMFMLADKNTLDVPSYLGWSNFDRYGPWELSRTSPYFARRKGVESSIILQLPPSLRRFTGGFGRQDAVLPSKLVTGRKSCFFCLLEAVTDQYYKDNMVLNNRYAQFLWQFIYNITYYNIWYNIT